MVGEHNVLNALAALAVLAEVGAEPQALKEVLPGFKGVKKRQEVAGEFQGFWSWKTLPTIPPRWG